MGFGYGTPPPFAFGCGTCSQQQPACPFGFGGNGRCHCTLLSPEVTPEDKRELAAVVVTICNGNSYDDLYSKVVQQAAEGTYVATYRIQGSIRPLRISMETQEPSDLGELGSRLLADIGAVRPASVVFNWECCSGCTGDVFQESADTLTLVKLCLDRGHMVMCSDFSLKALIKQWDINSLGPCPFVRLNDFGGSFVIHFDHERLASCPSAQLQRAADLCERGQVKVNALSSTIAYTVDQRVAASTGDYTLEVLTVATNMSGVELSNLTPECTCTAGNMRGAAGHVLLTYPSGGMLLTSAGHWIELIQLDVSEERLIATSAAQFGASYSADVAQQLASAPSAAARYEVMQNCSTRIIQSSAPCSYSSF